MTTTVEVDNPEAVVRRLESDVAEVAGVLNTAHGRLVELAEQLIATGAWRGCGIKSVEHWLVLHAGVSPHRARQLTAIARRRGELPVTCESLTRGELSVDQVTEVARFMPAHNDAEGASLAKVTTVPQLRNTLSRYRFTDQAAGADTGDTATPGDADAVRKGKVAMFVDRDRFALHMDAPLDDGALIERALAEAKDALFQQGHPEVTWMDALLETCRRSLSTVESDSRTSRYRVYLHLDTDGAWLNQGPALPQALTDKLLCDGVVQPVWETDGAAVSVGRSQRIVPERTRRLILDRDRGCIVPGCEATYHLEVHHLIAWLRGGRTDTTNLACLCPSHHDSLHRSELSITGDADHPDTLSFTDQLGRAMPSILPPRPTPLTWGDQHPLTCAHAATRARYEHPSGGRIDNRCVFFTPADWVSTSGASRPHAPPT